MGKSFYTTRRYFDNKNYPKGFARCGYFTIKESQLLEYYGHAYFDLEKGYRSPITEMERDFVLVFHNGKCPSNEHEKVWYKYIENIKKPKKFYTLTGGKYNIENIIEEYMESEEDL